MLETCRSNGLSKRSFCWFGVRTRSRARPVRLVGSIILSVLRPRGYGCRSGGMIWCSLMIGLGGCLLTGMIGLRLVMLLVRFNMLTAGLL